MIETQKEFQQRIEELNRVSISYEYRLRAIEKKIPEADIGKCLQASPSGDGKM